MPAKKPVPALASRMRTALRRGKRSTPSARPATLEPPKPAQGAMSAVAPGNTGAGVFALVAICVIVAAVVLAVRQGSEPTEAADANTAATLSASSQPSVPVAPPKVKVATKTVAADSNVTAATGTAAPRPSSALSATTTVAGCLERADSGYRLKNTSGADAPRTRSWKTGFFKKSSATIELVDSSGAAHLGSHVGERVSVTGALIDRQIVVHSLRGVAGSCR